MDHQDECASVDENVVKAVTRAVLRLVKRAIRRVLIRAGMRGAMRPVMRMLQAGSSCVYRRFWKSLVCEHLSQVSDTAIM